MISRRKVVSLPHFFIIWRILDWHVMVLELVSDEGSAL